jgi:HK97 family phage major capsid protein
MKSIIDTAEREERDLDAAEQESSEKATRSIAALDQRIEELTNLMEANKVAEEQRGSFQGGNDSDRGVAVADQFRALAAGEINGFNLDIRNIVPEYDQRTGMVHTRDLTVGTGSEGGDTVPTSFVRRLYEHLIENSAIRQTNVTVVTTSSGETLEFPKTLTHGAGQLTAEGIAIAENDPTFGKVALGAYKFTNAVQVSMELLQDTGVDLEGYLARDLGRAVANDMGTDFIVGDGTAKPNGVSTASVLGVTGAISVAGAFDADDLIDLQYSVIAGYANRGTWMMRRASEGATRKLKGSDNNYLWQPGLQIGSPNLLLGRPVVTDPNMAAIALSAVSVLFGDFSTYIIRDVGSVRIQRSDDFAFTSDLATFKAVWRSDGDQLDLTGSIKHFVGGAT